MKPHDLSSIVDTEEGSFLIMSQAAPSKSDDHLIFTTATTSAGISGSTAGLGDALGVNVGSILMDESVSMDEFKMSPATDALEFLLSAASHASLEPTTIAQIQNDEQMDPNALLVDLNDLLRRDPTLSSLGGNMSPPAANDVIGSMNSLNSAVTSLSMAIPKRNVTLLQPGGPYKVTGFLGGNSSLTSSASGLIAPPPSIASSFNSASMWGEPLIKQELKMEIQDPAASGVGGQTYSTLTSMPTDDIANVKMETTDFDDLDALFLTSSSPNVSLGLGQQNRHPAPATTTSTCAVPQTLKNMNFWQMDDFAWGPTTSTMEVSAASKDLLSSSVPATLLTASSGVSPLSDILTDLSSPSTSQSPSQAGPQRHSTLHKLLMRKEVMRPVPQARSPDSRKTLDRMKTSLSSSNPLLSQQPPPLSKSAPTTDSLLMDRIWKRREPRTHFTSVCSVGESSVTDEVNDILEEMSPNNLQDIASDDEEDEEEESRQEEKYSSDDDSDLEGTSPGGHNKSGSKKERHFWQYNVQAKGPKGQKILIQTKMEDPHVLNEVVDPVFSGDVVMQGIKHSGKARKGDGNDLTANPKKLAAIGKELEMLSKVINDLTPVSEMPFGARCKSRTGPRKEKNKLASRACRLKKKAQHEANKLKLHGLQEEHRELVKCLEQARSLLVTKVDPNSSMNQLEITAEIDRLSKKAIKAKVAGCTAEYVNKQIEKHLPFV